MRLLRELDEATAQRLSDALSDQGIATDVKPGRAGGPGEAGERGVWVIDETHMARATELSTGWLDGSEREAFELSALRGRRTRELALRIEERRRRQVEAVARNLQAAARPRPTPLTYGLIALCVAVGILTELGKANAMVATLTISDLRFPPHVTFVSLFGQTLPFLSLPWHEPWRLVTPVLVHFGPFHIFFNMLMLRDLGRIVESTHGSRYLALFVLVSAVVSNIAQYEIGQSARFAGISGVVYGLLALVWLRGRLDPWVGYGLSRATMQFGVIWLLLGFFPNFGIAKWCHLFGLLVGLAWAAIANKLARR